MLLRRNNANGAFSSNELLRRFSECLQQNEALNRRVNELERELRQLRAKLAEAESEIAALRALLVHVARSEFRVDESDVNQAFDTNALREERNQLLRNIEQLRLHIARYGEDLFVQNRIEAMQKRLAEIEQALDRAEDEAVSA
jgi:chromosome segregation ATPase